MEAENPANWKEMRTHIEVEGFVTYLKLEKDGDLHIRIFDSAGIRSMNRSHCIVAECIPKLPCVAPKTVALIRVRGISRYDAEKPGHHWWEVHPVESIVGD